jgi:hypothetical protein
LSTNEDVQKTPSYGEVPAGCTLAHAEAGIRRCLRAVGPVPEGERHGAEWRAVEAWCASKSLIASAACKPEREGGREHDLRQLSGQGVWLKFTKPWSSGYAVDLSGIDPLLLPARPLQYLERLRLQNRCFGDFIRFIGITADSKERRIIISQPDIIGRPPTWDEIDDWFLRQGFAKLNVKSLGGYDAVAFAGHGVGVFDVRPVNVVMSSDGILLPIDVMMRRMSKTQVLRLHRLDDPTAEALIRAINKSRESGAGTLAELRNPFED